MRVKKFDTINVVPFIDIMLVLLVIVLTTATFVARGIIPVDLSQAKSTIAIKKYKPLVITIKVNNKIFFNKNRIYLDEVQNELKKFKKDCPININCDKNAKFENFVSILDILKQNGYNNLGIITKNE